MASISNIAIIRETLALCQQDEALAEAIRTSVSDQSVQLQGEELPLPAPRFTEDAQVIVSKKRTLEAARAYVGRPTAVLNFANPIHPGGGVMAGSRAQEKALCRCSTLYPCLIDPALQTAFYQPHRGLGNSLGNDDCIYTPGVIVLREDTAQPALLPPEERYPVDVITCAAPRVHELRQQLHYVAGSVYAPLSAEELYALHLQRARRILQLAAHKGAEVIILGAFRCGAFGNDPHIVSRAMMDAVRENRRLFRTVEFAIYCAASETENYNVFAAAAAAL
jgi:uncharacterized protein (TIGR02452 family)